MFFLALAIGVAVGAGDDESEWRPRDEKKTTPARSLADDWDDDSTPAKQTTKPVKPLIRQIAAPPDDFEKETPKSGQWRAPGAKPTPTPKATAKKPAAEIVVDGQIMKADVIVELEDGPVLIGQGKPSSEPLIVQAPADEGNALKPVPNTWLLEIPKGLKASQPPKSAEINPTEVQTKNKSETAPKAGDLPTLPNPGSAGRSTDGPPAPNPMTTPSPGTAIATPTQKSVVVPATKIGEPPINRQLTPPPTPKSIPSAPTQQSAPKIQVEPKTPPAPTPKVDTTPATKGAVQSPPPLLVPPAAVAASPPVLMEPGVVDDSANLCMPLMDAVNAWRFEARSFLLWWDQPGTSAFVRDGVTDVGVLSGVDYDFKKQFAQQLSLERRIDAVTAVVISGLVTEKASQGAGAIAFGVLDLGVDGPGSGVLRNLSGFSGQATSRIWKVDADLVRHFLQQPNAPIRWRIFGGPQFIGLKESFGYRADGAVGDVVFDARTDNTLFGADVGAGVTFQPWYSNLGVDVSGRYGVFANSFDVRNDFYGPRSAFVGHGEDGTCRLATSAELNIEATLRIARNVCLLAGWRLWHIQGVGRTLSQVPTSVASPALVTTNSGTLFAHGLFLGATIGWGGVDDSNCRYGGARPYFLQEQ